MFAPILFVALALAGPEPSTADAVTLRDGSVVLGSVLAPGPHGLWPLAPGLQGKLVMIARRKWVAAKLPARSATWERAEGLKLKQARAQRVERLKAWRQERKAGAEGDDRIGAWIDAQLAELKDGTKIPPSRLMQLTIDIREVKSIGHSGRRRLLLLGWRCGLDGTEEMAPADLKAAVEGRGFLVDGTEPVTLDDLLPMTAEPEDRWLARRAATEVVYEPGLRFIRYQGLVLPEGEVGAAPDALGALGAIKGLLGDQPAEDPMLGKAREVAARGRVGLVETALEMAADFTEVKVVSTLWVRHGRDDWKGVDKRPATVRPDELKPEAGEELAADPQVKAAFGIVEGLGLGAVDPGLKGRSLKVGAASRRALHQAQGALDADLQEWALPVGDAPKPAAR